MLKVIEDLPDHVVGIRASGQVTAEDYQNVLVPEIEKRLSRHWRLRLLYVFGRDFEDFSAAAAWEDAKVGMRHFTHFERIAVVSDVEWLRRMVKVFGVLLPGEVRVFENSGLKEATAWISEPSERGRLEFELDRENRILILRPRDKLEAADFDAVASAVDPFIAESKRGLAGVVVIAKTFPGWDDFAALASHLRFVREHHAKIKRVALVTSSQFLSALPKLAGLFVSAEVRRFEIDQQAAALAWVSDSNNT